MKQGMALTCALMIVMMEHARRVGGAEHRFDHSRRGLCDIGRCGCIRRRDERLAGLSGADARLGAESGEAFRPFAVV